MELPVTAIIVSVIALVVSISSMIVSWRTYLRDRAKLTIRASTAILHPGGAGVAVPILAIEFINAGRRPLALSSYPTLRVAGPEPNRVVIAVPHYFYNRPADGILAEAKKFVVHYPHPDWQLVRKNGAARCIGVNIVDDLGQTHYYVLPAKIAAWFNDEEYAVRPRTPIARAYRQALNWAWVGLSRPRRPG